MKILREFPFLVMKLSPETITETVAPYKKN